MAECKLEIRGQKLYLLSDKGVWWPTRKSLIVADVHLGKVETFQQHGIRLPSGSTQHDLNRLTSLIHQFQPERLIILGDWLHAKEAQNPTVLEQIHTWRQQHNELAILLISGNHDRRAGKIPEDWAFKTAETAEDAPFVLAHAPQEYEHGYLLCGHLHPAVQLHGAGKQRLKQSCFWIRPSYMVLPAFGSFTGIFIITAQPDDQIFIPVASSVIHLER